MKLMLFFTSLGTCLGLLFVTFFDDDNGRLDLDSMLLTFGSSALLWATIIYYLQYHRFPDLNGCTLARCTVDIWIYCIRRPTSPFHPILVNPLSVRESRHWLDGN
ncbi:hypothetical protein SCLCIDRAFT_495223 [Scleroderma citrinum Foug A]|uniref:Uncharacterized protein n=1 Tax=Scleroderma citrinum Foug A TaxID=1036808 RepID=A0A0C3EB59_9AGAM|nr:hypothetical protein SCLCIDRAFT_495223 [Scleroderma citrinum Foug A]